MAGAASAQTAPAGAADTVFRATTISLSAYGEIRQRPDQATISMGVTTEAPTAGLLFQVMVDSFQAPLTALIANGVVTPLAPVMDKRRTARPTDPTCEDVSSCR
jgi:uncharacterized protein YggE